MKSLGTRLALVISFVLFGLMLIAGKWIDTRLTATIHAEEAASAAVHANTLLSSLQTLMLNGQGTLAREWLDRMRKNAGIVDIRVLRRDGHEAFTDLSTVNAVNTYRNEVIFRRDEVLPHRASPPSDILFKAAVEGKMTYDVSRPEAITVLLPIPTETECLACHGYDRTSHRGVLSLSISTEARDLRVERMRLDLWVISAVLVFTIGVAMFFVLRLNVLKPIALLQQAIERVGKGDREARLPVEWKDEFGQLANAFNRTQRDLRATETRIRSVMDNVGEGVIIIDEHGTIESVNPAAAEIFVYTAEEMVGQNVSMLMPEPYRSRHDSFIVNYMRTGKANVIGRRGIEFVAVRKGGDAFPMEIGVTEMRLEEGRFFIGVVRDITERRAQSAALEYQALHDALTDLPNRSLLGDRLRQSVLRAQRNKDRIALLVMDLDRFKEINDTLGHHYGDLMLKQVARRVRDALRESDTVARLGGDEFAVLLSTSDKDHASQVADKILRSLERPIVIEGQALHVGASIGIAIYPDHGEDEMTLLRLADVAMYVAKRTNRGYLVYDPSKDEHNPRSLALLGDLRSAIDLDELVLHYQPKVDLRTEKIQGVEALVRWKHPAHGLMYPDEFIGLAEQTGLIRPLTMWVLKEAIRQLGRWRLDGLGLDMAVNMSVRNLQDAQFPERIAKIIETSAQSARGLWMEITETAIMADPARAQELLSGLNAMNIMLSIDDFGTGYSSLAYLSQLPVREIKIDKSFVRGMLKNDNDAVIVRSIVDLAHNIGMSVIAEGVENRDTYELLKQLGCDAAQGFYISRPLPADELDKWLSSSSRGVKMIGEEPDSLQGD